MEVRDNSDYANDDQINTYQIIEYFGEKHYQKSKEKASNSHPKT
jgi:hypothetical protein